MTSSQLEIVWAGYVVALTLRPESVAFKTNDGLAKIGRGPGDVANAQLHYTTFVHVVRVFDLRQEPFRGADAFTEAVVRLATATDVADDLLERMTHPGAYPAWDESADARRSWRKGHGYPMQHLRDYRNRVLHGGLVPYQVIRRMARMHEDGSETPAKEAIEFPRVGRETDYLDWRRLVGPEREKTLAFIQQDLDDADNIVRELWAETLAYFEGEWRASVAMSTTGSSGVWTRPDSSCFHMDARFGTPVSAPAACPEKPSCAGDSSRVNGAVSASAPGCSDRPAP